MQETQMPASPLWFDVQTSALAVVTAVTSFYRMAFATPADIENLQQHKLQGLLHFAARNVPFYRQHFGDRPPSALRLADFPIVSKEQMMDRFDDFVSDPRVRYEDVRAFIEADRIQRELFLGRYVICKTSGTTGRAGIFLIDPRTWGRARSLGMSRSFLRALLPDLFVNRLYGRKLKWAFYISYGSHNITYLLCKYLPASIRFFVDIRLYSVHQPAAQVARDMAKFQPDLIHAYPTALATLATELLRDGSLQIRPRVITTGSEAFPEAAQRLVAQVFPDAKIHQVYGATEFNSIAHQCDYGNFHLNADYCVLELPDQSQGVGKLLLTNLTNRIQPVIRYEMSDEVEVEQRPCPCHRPLPILRIRGRSDETFHLRDAAGNYHALPPMPIQYLFNSQSGIRKFTVVHQRQNHLRISFSTFEEAAFPDKARAIEAAFRQHLRTNGLADGDVTIDIVPIVDAPNENPGAGEKARAIYSLVAPPKT